MRGCLLLLSLCGLLLVAAFFDSAEAKRSSSSGSRKSGSSGGLFSRKKPSQTSQTSTNQKHQPTKNHTSGFGGSHGSSSTFLNQERNQANPGFGGVQQPQPGRNTNPIGFEHFGTGSNHRPSAPVMPGQQPGGLGSAFGGGRTQNTHVQSQPPYPSHNNPGGFGTNPSGGHYNQPGGFGTNPAGGTHNQPGGFGSNPVGGTHYNQPGGFPAAGTHYGQPGYGQQGGTHFGQPGYGTNQGGGYHPQGNTFGQQGFGNQPHNNYGGHGGYNNPSPGYNPGGFGGAGGYNQGGFGGGGYPGGYGGGHHPNSGGGFGNSYGGYPQGGMGPGGYKQNTGPGLGTGLLGGAAAALPLGLLVGYGLGSMGGSSSTHAVSPVGPSPSSNNDAFDEWLKKRTEEEKKAEEAKIAAAGGGAAGAGGAAGTGAASGGFSSATGGAAGTTTTVNETAIMNRILSETKMCPGGAGILDASFLNTLVPCNATDVDFNETELTEPYDDDCKTIRLSLIQLNTGTNENKTVELTIKQINVTTAAEPGTLAYDLSFDSCLGTIGDPAERFCVNKGFTIDPYHTINETLTFLHTANYSMSQFNTTLNVNSSCATSGACGPESKAPRNITSTFINLSLLPLYPVNILMSQCMIFKRSMCDPASTVPCDQPLKTVKQTINTNTTLATTDFANVNFILHGSTDIFLAFQNPPPASPAPESTNPGSSSTLTDTSTKSSATTI